MPDTDATPIPQTLILVSREDVQPYAANPRIITEQNVEDMAALIMHHGFRVPILVKQGNGVWDLVDGHLRLRAATLLQLETLPAIDVSDMTDEQISAFRLSVNKASELAGWDMDLLATELSAMAEDQTLTMSGFSDDELAAMLNPPAPPAPAPAVTEASRVAGQTVNQSADRRRVTADTDRVNLIVSMTAAQRTHAMARLDAIMQARGFASRADALLGQLELEPLPVEAPAAPAPKRRRAAAK